VKRPLKTISIIAGRNPAYLKPKGKYNTPVPTADLKIVIKVMHTLNFLIITI